jgi:hypothetical protein
MKFIYTKKYSILINFLRYGFIGVLVFAFLFQGIFINNITKTASAAVQTSSTPKITSVVPEFGKVGDLIEIDGSNLEKATSVVFNGIETTTLTSYGAEKITVTVPEGALSGKITIKSPLMSDAVSPNDFIVKGSTTNNVSSTLTTSNITSNSVTVTATGLTIGSTYRLNIFNGSNVLKSNWDLNSVSSSTITTTSPTTSPLSTDTSYIVKISDGTKYIASANFNTISESSAGAVTDPAPTNQPPSNSDTNYDSNNGGSTNSSVKFSGLVPICNTIVDNNGGFKDPCDFNVLLAGVNKLINFVLITLATPLFVLIIIYVAWLYLSDMGSAENVTKAKKILKNAIVGYIIALAAWLIVKTILSTIGFNPKDAFLLL